MIKNVKKRILRIFYKLEYVSGRYVEVKMVIWFESNLLKEGILFREEKR